VTPDSPVGKKFARIISDATEVRFDVKSIEAVSGGSTHTTVKISGKNTFKATDYFAKLAEVHLGGVFRAEAQGLAALREANAITVPEVVAHGEDDAQAWLVLEWLELTPLDARNAAVLGEALAKQHREPHEKFGWARDNFIGASPQLNGWSPDWLAFWRAKRLIPQLQMAARNRLPSKMIDRGERLAADCGAFFSAYVPAKSLLHGDLWGGNASSIKGEKPAIFDPSVYVGDREADVAMTELFGGFPPDFMSAYRTAWPLDDGYRTRRDFYNLYHVLNHANLFAGAYVARSADSIEKLLAEIG